MFTPAQAPLTTQPSPAGSPPQRRDENALQRQAQAFEASFLAEMLNYAAASPEAGAFDGGIGEAQFASFLRAEQAQLMAARGGIGLAAALLRSIGEKDDA